MIYLKKIVFYVPIWMALLAKGLSLENFAKCTNHNQCPENSICSPSACDGYTCRCREGYVSSDDKVQCLPVRRMGDRCDASNKCLSPFSLCEDSCFCNDLLEATQDGRCKDPLFRYVGETCWMEPCQPPALCSDEGMCVCPPGMRKLKNEEFWLNPMIITQCVENDFSVHSCKGKLLEIPAGLLPTTPTIAPMTKPATSPVPSTTSVQQPSIEPIKPPMAQFLSTMPLRPTTETLPDTTSVPLYKIIYPDRRFPRRAFEICTNNTQCPENSRCRPRGCMGYVCICDEGYIASDNRHYCLKATKVGEPCNRLESKCMSPFSYCDGECRCLDVFEPTSDGRCKLPGIGFQGDTCSNSSCEYPAECLNGRCTCTGDYRPVSEEEFWVDPSDLRQCRKKSTSLTSCNGVVVPVPDEMKVSTTSTMKATAPLSSSASTEIQTTSTEPQTTSTEPQTTRTEPQTTTEPETTTEPQTTSPEPQITTTEPQTTTTEPQTTTTTEPQTTTTTTTEPQTTTTEQQTTTTEPQTTTTTTTEQQATTTTTVLRTTTEPQTTTTESKTTAEPQITTTEPPTTTKPQTTTTEPQTTTTSTEPPTTSTDPPTTSTEPPTTSTETPTTSIETPTTSTETTTASTELQTTSTESKSTSKEPQSTTFKTTTTESQTSTSAPTTTDPQTSSTIQQATDFKTTVTNQITSTKPQTTSSSKQSTTEPRTSTSQQATDTQTTTSSLTTQEETTTTIAQTLTNTGQDIPESTISTEFSIITTENHISTTLPQSTAFQSTTTTTTEQTTSEAQTTSTSSPEQQTTTTRTSTEKGNEWQSTLKQSVTITIPQTTTATLQITSGTLQNTLKSETTDREIQTTAQSEPTTTQSVTSTPSETTTEYGIPVTTTGVNTMKNPTINTHITESQAATTTSQTTPQIGTTASGQQTTKELQTASHSTTTEPENTTTRTTHISETTSGQQTTSRLQTTETMTSSSTSNMTENGMDRTTSATTTMSFTTIDKVSEGNLNDTNNAVKTNTTNYRENLTKSDTFSTTPIYVNSTLQRLSNGSEETFLVAFTTEVSTSTHNIQVASTMDMFQPGFNLTNIQYASTLETSTNYLTQKENNSSSDVKTVHFSPTPVISPSSDYVDATGHLSAITDSFNSIDIFVDTSYIQQDHNISIDNKSDMSALSTESDNTRSEMDLTTTHKVETFSFVGSSNEKLHKFTSTSGYIYSTANEIVSSKTQERVQSLQSIHLYASDSTIQTRQMKKDEEMSGLFSSSSPVDSKDISEINSLYGITTTPLYSSEIFESTGSVSPFTSMDTYGMEASSEIEDQFKSSLLVTSSEQEMSTSSQDRTPTSYVVDESHSFGSSYHSSTPSNMHTAISSEPDSDYVTESSTLELEIMPSRTISADKTPSGPSVTPIYNTKDLNEENTKLSKIVHAFLNNTYLQTSYTDVGDVSTSYTTFSENVLPTTDLLLETMTFHTKQTNVGENTSYANQENTESPSPSGMDITSIGSYQHSTSSAMPARHVTVTSTTAPIAHSLYISNATSHHVKAYENKSVLYDSVVAMSSSSVTSVPSVTSTTDNIIFIPSTKEDGKGVAYTNDVSQEVTVNEVKLDPRKPIKTIYQDLIYVVKRDPDKAQNPTVSKQDNLEGDLLYESEADKTLLNEEISNTDSRDNKTRSKDTFIGKTPSNTNSTITLESDSILIIPSISQSSSNSSSVDQLQFGERINGISNYTSFQWDYFNSTSNVSFETVQPSYEAMTTSSLQSSDVVVTTINGSTYLPRMNSIYTLTSDEGQSSIIVNDARNLFHSSSGYAITNSPSLSNNEINPTAASSFSSSYSLQTPTSLPLLQMSNTIYNDKRSASASAISELHDIDATKSSVYSKNTNKSVLDPGFKWASTGGLLNTNTSVIFATWVDPSFSSTYISLNENLRLESSTRSSFSVTPSSSEVLALSDSLFQTSLSYNVDIRKHMNFSEYEMLNDSNIKDILHKSLYDDFTGARDQGANDEEDTTPASISTIGDMLHLQTKRIHSLSMKSHVDPSFDDAHWNSLDSQDLWKSSDHDSFHYTTESLMQRPSFHLEHQSFLGTEYPTISASLSKTRPLGTYDKSKIHSPISIDTKNTSSEYENTILPSDSIAMEEIPIPTNSIFTGIPSHILQIHKDNLTSSSNNISTTNSTVDEQDLLTNLQTSISHSNGTGMDFSRKVILDDDFHSELFSNSKYLYSESSKFSDSVDLRMVSSVTYDGLIFPTSSLGYITQEQTLSPSTILRRSDEILPELNSLTSTNENVIDKLKSSLQTLSLEILYNTDTMVMLDSSRDLSSRMKQPQLEFSEIINNPNGFQLTSSSFDYHTSEANMGSSNIQRSVENSIKLSVHILQSDLPTSVLPSNGTRSNNLMHTDNNDRALDSSYLQSSFSKSNMETSIFVDSFANTNKQTREFQTSDGFTATSLFTNFLKSSDFLSHEELHALRDPSVDKVGSSSTVDTSSSDVNSRLSNDTVLSVPGTPDGFISTLLNFTTTIEALTTNDTMTTLFEETTPIMVDIPVGSEGTTPIAEKPGVTPPKLKELEINLEGFIIPAVIAGVFLINLLGVILALAHRRKRRLKSEKSPSVRTTIVSDDDLEANSFRIPRPNILFPPYYVKENWGTWTSSHFNIYESSLFAQIDNIYDEIGKSRTSSNIHSTT